MQIKLCYPTPGRAKRRRETLIRFLRWPFLFAAYICPILNIVTGGQAWSLIVLWSLWILWSSLLSPALVEYNRISQLIKLVANACVLLLLIDLLLSPGWAAEVVPIVCSSGLALTGTLFFTDLERQRQNMFPMLLLILVSILCAIAGLVLLRGEGRAALAVMGALAFALLAGCALTLGRGLVAELKKRFHSM
ncbi:MAG: DUF6320 domain-containing protein [Clostridia bacterium]|nr:DUF6320 domain-containing protein [Clostridia bacterium]